MTVPSVLARSAIHAGYLLLRHAGGAQPGDVGGFEQIPDLRLGIGAGRVHSHPGETRINVAEPSSTRKRHSASRALPRQAVSRREPRMSVVMAWIGMAGLLVPRCRLTGARAQDLDLAEPRIPSVHPGISRAEANGLLRQRSRLLQSPSC